MLWHDDQMIMARTVQRFRKLSSWSQDEFNKVNDFCDVAKPDIIEDADLAQVTPAEQKPILVGSSMDRTFNT